MALGEVTPRDLNDLHHYEGAIPETGFEQALENSLNLNGFNNITIKYNNFLPLKL